MSVDEDSSLEVLWDDRSVG